MKCANIGLPRRGALHLALALLSASAGLAPPASAEAWLAKEDRERAPRLVLRDLDGDKHKLSDLEGRIVVLNFWATWCGPCRLEMPAFASVHGAYRERGVEVVGAANETRQSRENVREFARDLEIHFPIWLEASLDHMEGFGVGPELPATVIVDSLGRIAARIQGVTDEARLRSILDRLLLERTDAAPLDGEPAGKAQRVAR